MSARPRFHEIDALRGLAAVTVVLSHSFAIFPGAHSDTRAHGFTFANVLKYSPLHAVWSGSQAVLVFFVISGFVLALPFVGDGRPTYRSFLVRRVARIWPAYLVACAVAFVVSDLARGRAVAGLSSWFETKWDQPITASIVGQHALLVDQFRTDGFDPVLWSLVHEMRISLVFPLLVWLVLRARPMLSVPAIVLWTVGAVHFTPAHAGLGDYATTPQYLGYFACGILVARYREQVVAFVLDTRRLALLAVMSVGLYTFPWWSPRHPPTAAALATMAGSAGIVVFTLAAAKWRQMLLSRPCQMLGRVSYSLYLVHAIVVLAVVHQLYGRVATWTLLPMIWVVSFAAAWLGERYVERPSIALGRRLTRPREIARLEPVR